MGSKQTSINQLSNKTKVILLLAIFFAAPNFASAYTVRVSTTNPDVHIPGGAYASPYIIATGNTKYILDGDMLADSSGIMLNGSLSNIIIDLNGHTITYNQVSPGVGIGSSNWSTSDVAIINGSIIQGVAMSVGVAYGTGSNPIRFYSGTPASYNVFRVQVAGITARYGSKDVGGIILGASGHLVEENSIEDTFEYGIVTDRHSGIVAIRMVGGTSVIRNNTIINARQRGIDANQNDEVYGNIIGIRSVCTNSYGVFTENGPAKIHDNVITARGEHPLGVGAHNSTDGVSRDVEIYNNTIDTQVTRIGTEYFGAYPADALTAMHNGDVAVGIRSTSGTQNLLVHDNNITVHSDNDFMGTYSPDGREIRMKGGARGIMTGLRFNTQSARFYNNTVSSSDKDGTGYAVGIACDANTDNNNEEVFRPPAVDFAPNLIFDNNVVTSDVMNIAFGDDYMSCHGNPLFIKNTLIKSGNFGTYATYGSGQTSYFGAAVRVISSVYQNGAAENSLNMHFERLSNNVPNVGGSYKDKSIIFGHLQGDGYLFYDYKLHNNEGTTGSVTPINVAMNELGPFFAVPVSDILAPSAPTGLGVL